MIQVLGGWTDGFIVALLAMGVFVSFRIFRFPDITVEGSFTFGAAVSAILMTKGFNPLFSGLASLYLWPIAWVPAPAPVNPLVAISLSFLSGMVAGATTGIMHTRFKIDRLLSGILVMTALYSINLRVMGMSYVSLSGTTTLANYAEELGNHITGGPSARFLGWEIYASNLGWVLATFAIAAVIGTALYTFFCTDLGTAMRATGDNDQMSRALGINVDAMIIAGLALSNGLVALSGSLFAQFKELADVQMGIGAIVLGMASVIMGEALVGGQRHLGLAITGAVMGSILFQLMVNLSLRAGFSATDQKLITAVFVFLALVLPAAIKRFRNWLQKENAVQEKT